MLLDRRGFLKLLGGMAAGAAGLARGAGALSEVSSPEGDPWPDYEVELVPTICQVCPGGCGILVRVVDGRAVKIEGNPNHPVNRGRLCPKGHAGLEFLYHPERVPGPLRRSGKRGEGRWQPISWEEAIRTLAARLAELRKKGEPHKVALLGGQYRGSMDGLIQRFFRVYGSPNYIRNRCLEVEKVAKTHLLTQGIRLPLSYDLRECDFILSFGCNLLESWLSPVYQLSAYAHLRQGRPGRRGKLVQVETRLSVTAAKADRWIPIRPGTDCALALGLAHVIVSEGNFDKEFVREHTFGFEDWTDEAGRHMGYKSLVLREYTLPKVSEITGVPIRDIIALARAFSEHERALALGERGPAFHPNDIYTRLAIHSLNALTGNLGKPGTVLIQGELPLTPWEEPELDEVARRGLSMPRIDGAGRGKYFLADHAVEALPRALLKGEPYGLEVLFFYFTNPLFSHPRGEELKRALARVPLVVSFSPFMDESALEADLVLPDSTYLERWQDDSVAHLSGFTAFSLGRPAVKPLHDTRSTGELLLELARAIGEPLAEAFEWESYPDLLYERAQGLYEAERGYVISEPADEAFRRILAGQGYRSEEFEDYDEFWEALRKRGAWWDPEDSYGGVKHLLKSESGRYEFYSQGLKRLLEAAAEEMALREKLSPQEALERILKEQKLAARGDKLFLPHYQPSEKESGEDRPPLVLNTYKLMSQMGGRTALLPRLQESLGVHLRMRWGNWAELNPATARRLGIKDGDPVWVESSKSRIKVRARVYAGAMPGVVNIPFGLGHTALSEWARETGANPSSIIVPEDDTLRGLGVLTGTRVKVRKA